MSDSNIGIELLIQYDEKHNVNKIKLFNYYHGKNDIYNICKMLNEIYKICDNSVTETIDLDIDFMIHLLNYTGEKFHARGPRIANNNVYQWFDCVNNDTYDNNIILPRYILPSHEEKLMLSRLYQKGVINEEELTRPYQKRVYSSAPRPIGQASEKDRNEQYLDCAINILFIKIFGKICEGECAWSKYVQKIDMFIKQNITHNIVFLCCIKFDLYDYLISTTGGKSYMLKIVRQCSYLSASKMTDAFIKCNIFDEEFISKLCFSKHVYNLPNMTLDNWKFLYSDSRYKNDFVINKIFEYGNDGIDFLFDKKEYSKLITSQYGIRKLCQNESGRIFLHNNGIPAITVCKLLQNNSTDIVNVGQEYVNSVVVGNPLKNV